jgi:prepilin-type N-terminal cleavage/methylation domain-containing protein
MPAAHRGFTTVELMIVIVIIAIAVAIGAGAYLKLVPESQKATASEHLRTLAGAIQIYYEQYRDYPAMRYGDISGPAGWPDHTSSSVPNAEQSIEALIYELQYRCDAGQALSSLPTKVLRQGAVGATSDVVTEGGQERVLYVAYDPWGNPIQYIRPRVRLVGGAPDANYLLSPERLNNRVLLISMGPDRVPGNPSSNPTWTDPSDGNTYPNPAALGTGDDIVLLVGRTP